MGKILWDLDESLCLLSSMGKVLTSLALCEEQDPDRTCLSDLGRVITNEAEASLEILQDHQQDGLKSTESKSYSKK